MDDDYSIRVFIEGRFRVFLKNKNLLLIYCLWFFCIKLLKNVIFLRNLDTFSINSLKSEGSGGHKWPRGFLKCFWILENEF